ncbi:hypothetical protein B0T17DRAFT_646604 [Bombardia bombarda]|uniref:Uncharacterized protein n=1 Tax=Bombardia bombarda TaxID=252184 RepID=A0AA39WGS9_9PEZI|nr:hypothetical protein B0T17DRAFT_646604 [Bombardia bombarda]
MLADDVYGAEPGTLRCCCGGEDCVFLRHNCSVLMSVERDVHAAAKMGQTLLARHEAYMASAERDRAELSARIGQIKHDNAELEDKNKRTADENQTLRKELDGLNDVVSDADKKIELLEAALRDSQHELRRLERAEKRAVNLEREIAMLEEEHMTLQNTLVYTREEERTAMHRWKEAQRGLRDLQEQLERMEREAKEERERHVEVLARMERQRVMEKELSTAAGRLKGAAAARSLTDSKNGQNVVSHFVRDLLQDNANLQLGMAELREMLINSNDEIQMLQEQMLYHQPRGEAGSTSTLRAELEQKEPPTSPPASKNRALFGHLHPSTHLGTFNADAAADAVAGRPWAWGPFAQHSPKESNSALPMLPNGRWSLASENSSEFAPLSAPSSPPSNRRSSVFDRSLMDVSFPNSPTTSVDPMSPIWRSSHRKRVSELSGRSISTTAMFPTNNSQSYGGYPPPTSFATQPHPLTNLVLGDDIRSQEMMSAYTTDDIPDLTRNAPSADDTTISTVSTDAETEDASPPSRFDAIEHSQAEQRPQRLRRIVSHESIMSLSNGMDIHTLKIRPSQLTLRPLGLTTAGTNLSPVTARPTISRGNTDGRQGSAVLRDNLAIGSRSPWMRGDRGRVTSGPIHGSRDRSTSRQPSNGKLGKLASWRPWAADTTSKHTTPEPTPVVTPAATPAATPVLTAATAAIPALLSPIVALASKSAQVSPQGSLSSAGTFRAPGINQPGMIPGFQEYWAAHQRRGPRSRVTPDDLGQIQEAMREVLDDG